MLKDQQVKADINNVDEEHQAALHYAARYNHYEIVKLLVENGAGKLLAGHIDMNKCRALVPEFRLRKPRVLSPLRSLRIA